MALFQSLEIVALLTVTYRKRESYGIIASSSSFRISQERRPVPLDTCIFYQLFPTCFGRYCAILREKFLSLAQNHLYFYKVAAYCIVYCGRVPTAEAPGCTAAKGLLYKPWSLVVPNGVSTREPSSERRNYLGEKWPVISTESRKYAT